jgi:UPF0271 protein
VKRVDVNVDVGEGFEFDDALVRIATSANVCCGAHAGSVELCLATVEKCRERGVRVGAHPGFPDRGSMGRAPFPIEDEPDRVHLLRSLMEQCSLVEWDFVKPHGALYNVSTRPGAATVPLVATLLHLRLPLMGMPGTHHEHIAFAAEVPFIREGFADRAYLPDGRLLPRTEAGAVLSEPSEISAQVLVLAERVDSICVHGDSPGCVEIAALVRSTLEKGGYEVGW